ncbi:hypothetical protein N7467_006429 [Penicillium canescens]|nr:hypothetical protein N7467_006429 [Penicillium canescens]
MLATTIESTKILVISGKNVSFRNNLTAKLHTELFEAVEVASLYLETGIRMSVDVISGGKD